MVIKNEVRALRLRDAILCDININKQKTIESNLK